MSTRHAIGLVFSGFVMLAACEPAQDPHAEIPKDARRAVALAEIFGTPKDRDVAHGLTLLRAACDEDDRCACAEEAIALARFDARPAALGRAIRLDEAVCEARSRTHCPRTPTGEPWLGDPPVEMVACYNWSDLLARGVATGVDGEDAAMLRTRACKGGYAAACDAMVPSP